MILELENSKYDVKVDSNICITLSEIAFNKTKMKIIYVILNTLLVLVVCLLICLLRL